MKGVFFAYGGKGYLILCFFFLQYAALLLIEIKFSSHAKCADCSFLTSTPPSSLSPPLPSGSTPFCISLEKASKR